MILYLAAFLGGLLTLLSPCILPVLPFLLARAGQPWLTVRLPMLAGMALVFAAVTTLASAGAAWTVQFNEIGRSAALLVMALFGLALLWPPLAVLLGVPGVALGNRLAERATRHRHAIGNSLLLGAATGLLWTPCAGPILGLLLSGAAWQGPGIGSATLLLAYAAGAATGLGLGMFAGCRLMRMSRRLRPASQWLQRGLGVAVLAGVASVAAGADLGLPGSSGATEHLETLVLDTLAPSRGATGGENTRPSRPSPPTRPYRSQLPVQGQLPSLEGAVQWLNSPPLTAEQLRGKVVLVDFWTYSCINCIRTLPYVRAWAEKYKDQGLVVIGVHTPEFAFEKKIDNVGKAVDEFHLGFPVAVDSDFRLWRAFGNNYWPAFYLADAQGRLRYHQFGEGHYAQSEQAIRELLREAGSDQAAAALSSPDAPGIQAAPDLARLESDETYLGYRQASGFTGRPGLRADVAADYSAVEPGLNQWSLAGNWRVGAEAITLQQAGGSIRYRFSARDLHLVLGPAEDGRPVRLQVSVDGKPPGALHGSDTDAAGNATVTRTRLFQLVRQRGDVGPHTFEVRFLDPGATAYAFTFG